MDRPRSRLKPDAAGVILGRSKESGALIRHTGDAHLITFAATGKGKTSGPIITNARTYPGQLLVIDVKGEIYRESADHRRAMGQKVYAIDLSDDPAAPDCLNPCDIARRLGNDMLSVARSMAKEIAPTPSRDPFWNNWSVSLIQAALAHLLISRPETATLDNLYRRFVDEDTIYKVAVSLDTENEMNRASYRAFAAFLGLTDVTRSGVHATVVSDVEIFGTTLAKRLTDNTSFDLDALVEGRGMTIYFIVPPDRIRAFAPLIRLWFSLLMLLFTKRQTEPAHPTLFLIDEAAQLGRMDSLLTAMTLLRSYSFRVWSVWQSASQLKVYGSDMETLLDNAGVVQVMGLANMRAARDTADLMGGITADELMALEPDEQALMIDGRKPIVAKQVRYYLDPMFAGRDPTKLAR